jgi:hypothetical protein
MNFPVAKVFSVTDMEGFLLELESQGSFDRSVAPKRQTT